MLVFANACKSHLEGVLLAWVTVARNFQHPRPEDTFYLNAAKLGVFTGGLAERAAEQQHALLVILDYAAARSMICLTLRRSGFGVVLVWVRAGGRVPRRL